MHDESLTRHGQSLWARFRSEFVPALIQDTGISDLENKNSFRLELPFSLTINRPDYRKGTLLKSKAEQYYGREIIENMSLDDLEALVTSYERVANEFLNRLRSGSLLAEGRVHPISHDLKRDVIRPGWWDLTAVVWIKANELWQAKHRPAPSRPLIHFSDITIWDQEAWEALFAQEGSDGGNTVGGRPAKYNWDQFWVEVAAEAHDNGLPSTQSEFIEKMLQWCENTWNKSPGESTIKKKISPLFHRFNRS